MKKFLFTLTALLMAGTAFAGRIYIPDTEFTPDQLGTQVWLPVYIELDNEYINGWNVEFTYPENLTVTGSIRKNTEVLSQTAVTDEFGSTETVSFVVNGNSTANTGFCAQQGFYDPDGDGEYEPYGAVKIGPTGTFMLYEIRVTPPVGFTEGYITMRWMYSGGADTRNGQGSIASGDPTVDNGMTTTMVHLYVKQDNPAPAATITSEGNVVTANVDGEEFGTHTVELYIINGNDTTKVDGNPYTVTQTYEEQKIVFIAKTLANEGETEDTWSEPKEVTIPALDKTEVDSPSVQGMSNDDPTLYNIIILGEGDGELNYTVKDAEGNTVTPKDVIVDDETGLVTLVFEKGEEAYTVTVDAYTAEGATCAESDHEVKDITIPALPQVAKPEITWTLGDNNTIIVTATCATEGATIVLKDPDGNVVDNPATVTYDPYEGYNGTWTATATKTGMTPSEEGEKTITITAEEKKDVESPSIQGMKHDGSKKLYDIIITPDPATDGQLQYTANPMGTVLGAKAAEPVTIQYERQAEDYNVVVTAKTLEGATCKESPLAEKTITVPKLDQVAKPTVNWSPNNDGTFDIWVTCDTEDATITLTDGENTYTLTPGEHKTISYDIYEGYEGTWTATASATDMLDNTSDPKEIYIEEQPKVYTTPDPVIDVVDDPEAQTVTITVTGEGAIHVDVVGFVVNEHKDGTNEVVIEIPYGTEVDFVNIHATAVAPLPAGYDDVVGGEATEEFVEIPKKVEVPQTDMPDIHVTEGKSEFDDEGHVTYDGHFKEVTFENMDETADEDVVIEYCTGDPEVEDNWQVWDGEPLNFSQNGTYDVYVRATAKDKETSEVNHVTVVVDAATGLNEVANGKTVAGVRYFNMAGQEMQEANGITIVVTTYTDGTTSAVKVIK